MKTSTLYLPLFLSAVITLAASSCATPVEQPKASAEEAIFASIVAELREDGFKSVVQPGLVSAASSDSASVPELARRKLEVLTKGEVTISLLLDPARGRFVALDLGSSDGQQWVWGPRGFDGEYARILVSWALQPQVGKIQVSAVGIDHPRPLEQVLSDAGYILTPAPALHQQPGMRWFSVTQGLVPAQAEPPAEPPQKTRTIGIDGQGRFVEFWWDQGLLLRLPTNKSERAADDVLFQLLLSFQI